MSILQAQNLQIDSERSHVLLIWFPEFDSHMPGSIYKGLVKND